jgi:light-regulated signal transduction histidine kinase (bacteriophytochrome)
MSVADARPQQPTNGVDLSTCDREPIHIPGSIQPHGVLLALAEPTLTVTQVSANVQQFLGRTPESVLNHPIADVLGQHVADQLRATLGSQPLDRNPVYLSTLSLATAAGLFNAIIHRNDGVVIVEVEPAQTSESATFQQLYPMVRTFVNRLQAATDVREICRIAADEVRRITGFDRVLVYQFDKDWNGTVVGESRDDVVYGSFMDLRFPASDIPAQARELYRANRLRLIVDASYRPSPLVPATNPATGRPLDLTFASLRSVSPVHVEYLHNMGLVASMSISILRDGQLWGLISCHHKSPRNVSFEIRTACDFLGQVLSVHLDARERAAEYDHRMRLKEIHGKLLAYMAGEEHFAQGLLKHPQALLALTGAQGAAVVFEGRRALIGHTPTDQQVAVIIERLSDQHGGEEIVCLDSLAGALPGAEAYKDTAAGLLAIEISKLHNSYILWFRPEVIQTVTWGGDPRKPVEPEPGGQVRLHPRKSFEAWKETVRLKSIPWRRAEEEAALDLRNAVVGIVLRKAEELAELTAELERSNKELEAFSYSVSHDLRAPFRHIVGYAELLRDRLGSRENPDGDELRYIETIIESANFAGTLVDNLLAFSQMGRSRLTITRVDLNQLFEEVRRSLTDEKETRRVTWRVAPLPTVHADLVMLRLVVQNLLSNALKYTRPRDEAVIDVGAAEADGEWVVHVRDNGVGFDMRYVDKLFGVFQRLHRIEEFEGTGIGLANVRRIVTRHGGRTWARGKVGEGATFFFSLPRTAQTGVTTRG